jgi:hypothetical protein
MSDIDYATDLYGWTMTQAAALRAMQAGFSWEVLKVLDLEHLAEEIEALGSEQEHAIESQLRILLMHLLKWQYQPSRQTRSWRTSIRNARIEIRRRLQRNPSLQPKLQALTDLAYPDARMLAADETGIPLNTFPTNCPWTLAALQNEEFLPSAEDTP